MAESGFGIAAVRRLVGAATYRQLDHWAKTGLVTSSIKSAAGKGSRRIYSFNDLVALRVVARLRDVGVSLQKIRKATDHLRQHAPDNLPALSAMALLTDGKHIYVKTGDPQVLVAATARGQTVIAMFRLDQLVRDLHSTVTEIRAPRSVHVAVRGHTYDAVLTPDLEVGGYTVEVPELPGCITEGDNVTDARRMAKDAIAAWLDSNEEQVAAGNG